MTASQPKPHSTVGMCVLLTVVVSMVFCQTIRHEFVNYDDDQYFYANPHVKAGLTWGNVIWAFQTMDVSNWHPLTWLSLMLDTQLFGFGPAGSHLTNALLHAVNSGLLFLLLRRLSDAYWRSAIVAALFGLHPLHVESVAWASERKDVLSGLFFMLTLLMYARYVRPPKVEGLKPIFFYGLALLFFVLALMSKPMLVTLPCVLLLLDYWPLNRFSGPTRKVQLSTLWRLVSEKFPFLAFSVASSAVTFVVQKNATQSFDHLPMDIRAVNAMVACVRYLQKMFWPVDLAIPYPYPGHWSFELFWLSAAFFLSATCFVVWRGRKFPFLITGWFWYLGMLVPVIGLVQVGAQSMADRYTYLPLIGIFIPLVWGAGKMFESWRLPKPVVVNVVVLLLLACAIRTLDQLRYWKNTETLFRHTLAVTKDNATAYYNLGEYYFGKGQLDLAVWDYLQAVQIKPSYADALNNLGVALALKGELDEAVARIRKSISYQPEMAEARYNLGNVLVMQHKLNDAINAYREALRLNPDYSEAHNNLANLLATQGHLAEARKHYQETLRLNPNHEGAKHQLQVIGTSPSP